MSGSASTHPISSAKYGASLPPPGGRPCRAGSAEPVRATRAASFTAKLALTLNRSAAPRRDCPSSISASTRSRSAIGCGFPMHAGLQLPANILNQISDSLGIPIRFLFRARRSSVAPYATYRAVRPIRREGRAMWRVGCLAWPNASSPTGVPSAALPRPSGRLRGAISARP